MGFNFEELDLEGAYIINNYYSGDRRGNFMKIFEKDEYLKNRIKFNLTESFSSRSAKNVIRGLHFQINSPQAKIVSVVSGSVWDVIVDLRPDSPTFKQWRAQVLSADNHLSFFIPKGFAHGFVSLIDDTVMIYQCDGKYDAKTDTGIIFNDKEIGIEWPINENVAIHSDRDMKLGGFQDYLKNPMKL